MRGALYVVIGGSLLVALLLGERGVILDLDEILESLFVATAGKAVVAVIGLAFVIYGFRKMRLVR